VPRAPTYRGELAQRAAGIVAQVLAHPKVVAPVPPPPADFLPPAPPDGPPTPSPNPTVAWPPPPGVWESGPGPAPNHPVTTPTHAAPGHSSASHNPAPGWAGPGPGWTRGGAPDFARSAASWARAVTGRGRLAASRTRPATPSNYLWQSVACLLLFAPSAIVAIVYAAQVNRRVQVGDMTGAVRASRLARTWCLITVVVFTLVVLWTVAGGTLP
jgi:Interferon-induced transmembrane protein